MSDGWLEHELNLLGFQLAVEKAARTEKELLDRGDPELMDWLAKREVEWEAYVKERESFEKSRRVP